MTAPMTLNFSGLGALDGHHDDMKWCQERGDQACVQAIEYQVKLYNQTRPQGTLGPDSLCYEKDTCDPSPELASIIKGNPYGLQSRNIASLMDGYIKGGLTGSDFTDDPAVQDQIDATKEVACRIAAAAGQQLPGCPALTGGASVQTTDVNTPAPSTEPNWLLYGGIALGALVLLGGVALVARKRSGVHGLRGLGCGYAGCHGFSGLGKYQPWNARAAARYNSRQYPCR